MNKPYIKKYKIDGKRLAAQFIPLDENLWRLDRYEEFLQVRRSSIAKALNEYLGEYGAEYMVR